MFLSWNQWIGSGLRIAVLLTTLSPVDNEEMWTGLAVRKGNIMNFAKMPVVVAGVTALSLGSWGCATKKHVREAIAPVQNQVNTVQKETADNKQAIGDLDRQVAVADEKATDAGQKAAEANSAAGRA